MSENLKRRAQELIFSLWGWLKQMFERVEKIHPALVLVTVPFTGIVFYSLINVIVSVLKILVFFALSVVFIHSLIRWMSRANKNTSAGNTPH